MPLAQKERWFDDYGLRVCHTDWTYKGRQGTRLQQDIIEENQIFRITNHNRPMSTIERFDMNLDKRKNDNIQQCVESTTYWTPHRWTVSSTELASSRVERFHSSFAEKSSVWLLVAAACIEIYSLLTETVIPTWIRLVDWGVKQAKHSPYFSGKVGTFNLPFTIYFFDIRHIYWYSFFHRVVFSSTTYTPIFNLLYIYTYI